MFGVDQDGRDVLSGQFAITPTRGQFPRLSSSEESNMAEVATTDPLRRNEKLVELVRARILRDFYDQGTLTLREEQLMRSRERIISLRLDAYDASLDDYHLFVQSVINCNIGQIDGERILHHRDLENALRDYERGLFLSILRRNLLIKDPIVIDLALKIAFEEGCFDGQEKEIGQKINNRLRIMAAKINTDSTLAQSALASISGIFENRTV